MDYEKAFKEELEPIEPDYRDSARNLLHYLSVRQHDLRHIQDDLSSLGLSSLGRLTDAAMSGRAECVMLNKGPHIVEALEFLSDVLDQSVTHQFKKRAMLRRLSVSQMT